MLLVSMLTSKVRSQQETQNWRKEQSYKFFFHSSIPLFRKLYLAEVLVSYDIVFSSVFLHYLTINNVSRLILFSKRDCQTHANVCKKVHTYQSRHIHICKNIYEMDEISFFWITVALFKPHYFFQGCRFLLWQLSVCLTSSYIASTDTRTGRLWQVGPN